MSVNPQEPSFVDLMGEEAPVAAKIIALHPEPAAKPEPEPAPEALQEPIWRAFARKDLARSALSPELMQVAQGDHDAGFGVECYAIVYQHVHPPFAVTRFNTKVKDDRYRGPKGRTEVYWSCSPAEFAKAPITAILEGEKKARLFYLMTGIPTVGIRGGPGWSDRVKAIGSDSAPHRVLKSGIQAGLGSGRTCIIGMDGDFATNGDISRELAQLNMACREMGSDTMVLDFGFSPTGERLGADDFLISIYGPMCVGKVPHSEVLGLVLSTKYKLDIDQLIASEDWCMQNLERYNSELVDFTDRGNASLALKILGSGNFVYLKDLPGWIMHDKELNRWVRLVADLPTEVLNRVSHYRATFANTLEARLSASKAQGRIYTDADMELHLAQVKAWRDSAAKLSSFRARSTILSELRGRDEINDTLQAFTQHPDFLATANGVVDLRTGVVRDEKQSDKILDRCSATYLPGRVFDMSEGSVARRTRDFISSVFARRDGTPNSEKERYAQRRLGASLRGRCELGALEVWQSVPGCGKGVLADLICGALGPDLSKTVNVDSILTGVGTGNGPTTFLMSIARARFVFLQEADRGARWNHRMFKTLTGVVDTISAREMYGKATNFLAPFTLILLCNDIPDQQHSDAAMLQRLAILPLEHAHRRINQTSIAEGDEELPAEDLWLRDCMSKEQDARDVILAWLIEGGVLYEAEGLGEAPPEVAGAKVAYADRQALVKNWLISKYDITGSPHDHVQAHLMHAEYYEEHKLTSNTKPLARQDFQSEVLRAFPQVTYGRAARGHMSFIGIKARFSVGG